MPTLGLDPRVGTGSPKSMRSGTTPGIMLQPRVYGVRAGAGAGLGPSGDAGACGAGGLGGGSASD